jgi:hypothetical protein
MLCLRCLRGSDNAVESSDLNRVPTAGGGAGRNRSEPRTNRSAVATLGVDDAEAVMDGQG